MLCDTCKGDPRGRLVVIHLAGERAWWFEPCPDCIGGPNAASCCDGLQAQPEGFASPGTPHSTAVYDPHCVRNRPGSRIADNIYENIKTLIDPAVCR